MARGKPSPLPLILIEGLLLLLGVTLLISAQPPEPRIVFEGINWKREKFWNIYTMDLNGERIKQLTDNPWHDACPDWSPDGREIAFCSGWDLAIMNWDGSNCRRLNTGTSLPQDPDWSPDGKKLAFAAEVGGLPDIFVLDLERGDVRNLTSLKARDASPSWSPDGRWIAFASDRDPRFWDVGGGMAPDIYVMDAQGGNIRNLTRTAGVCESEPAWSPDGTQIAYAVQDTAKSVNTDLYVMDIDNRKRRRLTDFKGKYPGDFYQVFSLSWADREHIIFSVCHYDGEDIYLINREGGEPRLIYHKRGMRASHPDLFGNVLGLNLLRLKKTLWGVIKR